MCWMCTSSQEFDQYVCMLMLYCSWRHTIINHYDRRITHLGDTDISCFVLSSKFLFYLVLLVITHYTKEMKYIN